MSYIEEMLSKSVVVESKRCPKCAASGKDTKGDNLKVYNDGHVYCYACKFYRSGVGPVKPVLLETNIDPVEFIVNGTISSLPHRNISKETCEKFGYTKHGQNEVMNFIDDRGNIQAQKVRKPDKDMYFIGDASNLKLWGQNLFAAGGKSITITEGEIDAMSVSQVFGNKYAVVSLPTGASSAVTAIKNNYEFVSSFDKIVLCFDMDKAGRDAAAAVADILPPGKVAIMSLPKKDANEMLQAGMFKELTDAYWQARRYSPDSILHVSDVLGNLSYESTGEVYEFPWDGLTNYMIGQNSATMYLWTSPPGSGKSTMMRALSMHHMLEGRPVGCVFLEESPEQTIDDLISSMIRKPVGKIKDQRQLNIIRKKSGKPLMDEVEDTLTDEEYNRAKDYIRNLPMYIYDHMGNADISNIVNRLEFMAVGLGCKVIILDHITLLGNMMLNNSDSHGNDERLILDDIMKQLRNLIERTGVIIHVVAHLKKNDKNYDAGERISLNDLRGSGSLGQIANNVFGMERDAQNTDEGIRNTTLIRVLKNRKGGKKGVAVALRYNPATTLLDEVSFAQNEDGEVTFEPTRI